jgi:hypothetical protein
MKWEEKKALEYLVSEGFCNIFYEPDGNIPPDFLIDSAIAVEVRRLNQHHKSHGSDEFEPLEKLEFRLLPKIISLLKTYSNISYSNSALVTIEYSRPLKVSKKLIEQIKAILDVQLMFLNNIGVDKSFQINDNLLVRIWPTHEKYESAYIIGAISDDDKGGLLVKNVYENLKIVIQEKERKIKPYQSKYGIWWLILIDFIGDGLCEYDMKQLNQQKFEDNIFDKIILLDPVNPTNFKLLNH